MTQERKRKEAAYKDAYKAPAARDKKDAELEARRQLEIEVKLQQEEAQTRAMGQAMLSDAEANRQSAFNRSCFNLLNNFQGN